MLRILKTICTALPAFLLLACNSDKKVETETAVDTTPVSVVQPRAIKSPEPKPNTFVYDENKVVREVFGIDRSGIKYKEEANENSTTLGVGQFGARIEVVEVLDGWFGIRERVQRNYTKDDGTRVESSDWEKVYVKQNQTGTLDKIQLIQSDLNIITSLNVNEKSEYFEKGKPLKTYLKIELVDKKLFDEQRKSAVNFLLADTNAIIKKNGIITLPTANKPVKIIDKPEDGDYREEYEYVGQFNFLNQYLIAGSYYESMDYKFVDQTTGKDTQTFGEFPMISQDQRNIICIYANLYESTSDLELYAITGQKVTRVMSASFNKWVPTRENSEIFWSSDGYLYLAVIHIQAVWGESSSEKPKKQYIRIKLL